MPYYYFLRQSSMVYFFFLLCICTGISCGMERGHQHNNWVSMYQQRRPNPFLFFIPIAQEEMEGPLADNRILIIAINISRLITSHLIQKKKETIEEQIKRVREFNRYFPKIVYFSADSHIEEIRKCALKHLRTLPYTHLRTLHSEVQYYLKYDKVPISTKEKQL